MKDWHLIVRQHSQAVWQTAYRLLGNYADACDCSQETFLAVLAIARREPVRNWSALFRRVATTRALSRLRQRVRQKARREDLDDWAVVPTSNPGPEQQAEELELAVQLRKVLAELPAQEAEALCLRYLNDLSYEEIAQEMGIKSNSVGATLHRARSRVKAMLNAMERR